MILQNDSLVSAAAAHSKPLCPVQAAQRTERCTFHIPRITSSTDWGSPQTSHRNFRAAVFSKTYAVSVVTCIVMKKKDLFLGEKVIYYVIKEF